LSVIIDDEQTIRFNSG